MVANSVYNLRPGKKYNTNITEQSQYKQTKTIPMSVQTNLKDLVEISESKSNFAEANINLYVFKILTLSVFVSKNCIILLDILLIETFSV